MMNSFKTRSSPKKNILTVLFAFIPMFALALLSLQITVMACLFLEGMLLLSLGICLVAVAKTHWEITFEGDEVRIYNTGNRQSYRFQQLRQSDFHIRQSEKQKSKDTCHMKLEDAPFALYDVQDCEKMQRYIQQNFPG